MATKPRFKVENLLRRDYVLLHDKKKIIFPWGCDLEKRDRALSMMI